MTLCVTCDSHHGERAPLCPERCLSCGASYEAEKPADCTGSHSWAGDVEFLRAVIASEVDSAAL